MVSTTLNASLISVLVSLQQTWEAGFNSWGNWVQAESSARGFTTIQWLTPLTKCNQNLSLQFYHFSNYIHLPVTFTIYSGMSRLLCVFTWGKWEKSLESVSPLILFIFPWRLKPLRKLIKLHHHNFQWISTYYRRKTQQILVVCIIKILVVFRFFMIAYKYIFWSIFRISWIKATKYPNRPLFSHLI